MKLKEFLLKEEKEKHAVLAFGRMNPISCGHGLLINKVHEIADQHKASHHIVLSHSQDPSKNPLSPQQKLKHARRFFPGTNFSLASKASPNFLEQAAKLHRSGVTHLHMVAGSDRLPEYEKILHKYNGTKENSLFNFKGITLHSAGERDSNAKGVSGMSASKMRDAAAKGDYKTFRSGIPEGGHESHAKEMYRDVRHGMNIKESKVIDLPLDTLFEEILDEGVHDKGIFKAVFLSGGPGSGKDFILSNTLDGHGLTEINSDKAFEYLMDKNGLDKTMPDSEKDIRNIQRGKAKNTTELRQRLALSGRNGLIINGTGDDLEKVKTIKKRLEDMGYETSMITVNTDDEVSRMRNIKRGQSGGRTVPEDIRKEKWDGVQKNRAEFAKMFRGNYHEFDNSYDSGTATQEELAAKKKEMLEIYKNVQKFVAKPPAHPVAGLWVSHELSKKDTLPIPKDDEGTQKAPPTGSKAAEEAHRLGLVYYGFGRYGKNGKVTHHSVNDKLIVNQGLNQNNVEIPVMSSSSGEKVKTNSRASMITRKKDVPEFEKKKLAKIYNDAKKKLPESLDAEFDELLNEMIGEPKTVQPKFMSHSDGTIRNFKLRAFAAKEAHTRNGSVVQTDKGYSVKLKESKDAQISQNNVGISDQERTNEECGNSSASGRTSTDGFRSESGSGDNSTKSKISLKEAKEKYQQIKEIDCGTEVGMSMAAGGESTARSSLSTKAKELPLEGVTKKGISLSSFKSKK